MIKFKNLSEQLPYKMFFEAYNDAIKSDQKNVEAIVISSYDALKNQVDSRFVNIKFIEKDEFVFFSNYNSPKSKAFISHDHISACFFWSSINTQIRMKATIKKTSESYNKKYFKERSIKKNALAISSDQSKIIDSYESVLKKYYTTLNHQDLLQCPKYWGGYKFKPYEIEFWKGESHRINKRDLYVWDNSLWKHSVLEP